METKANCEKLERFYSEMRLRIEVANGRRFTVEMRRRNEGEMWIRKVDATANRRRFEKFFPLGN